MARGYFFGFQKSHKKIYFLNLPNRIKPLIFLSIFFRGWAEYPPRIFESPGSHQIDKIYFLNLPNRIKPLIFFVNFLPELG